MFPTSKNNLNKATALETASLPVMRASGLDCSFLQAGTNTVISLCPFSKNHSTASWIPRQENTSLFPWLENKTVWYKDYFYIEKWSFIEANVSECMCSKKRPTKCDCEFVSVYLIATLEPSMTMGLRLSKMSDEESSSIDTSGLTVSLTQGGRDIDVAVLLQG